MAPDAPVLVRKESPAGAPEQPLPAPPAPPEAASPVRDRISRNWALVLGLGWPVTVAIATALEPAPTNPDVAAAPIEVFLGLVFTAGLLLAVSSAATRHFRAPAWSAMLGALALGLVVACPVSGHHGFGAWWIAELAVYGGMFAASIAAVRAAGPAQRSMSPRMK